MHVHPNALRRTLATGVGLALAVSLTACGDDDSTAVPVGGRSTSSMAGTDDHSESFSFGEPADPADADRTVDVSMLDSFSYEPASVSVEAGETVLFEVTNDGKVVHEFVLGDEELQQEHEQEMAEMDAGAMMADEPNAVSVEPGESKELAFTFSDAGTIQYACHQPGHYDAGMIGELDIE